MQIYRPGVKLFVLIVACFIANINLFSQFNTYSPYTRFGLGDLARQGFGQNLAMGGTGLAIHNANRINYLNPASFSSLDSTTVYFDFGANSYHNAYITSNASNTWWNMNLHHVAFATSAGKHVGFSAGIVPYSSVGYNIRQEYNDFSSGEAMNIYNRGDGGIMNFYAGTSLKILDRVSFGVTMNYLMGKLIRQRSVEFPINTSYAPVYSNQQVSLRKPLFTLGLQYKEVISDKFFFSLGGIYGLKSNINTEIRNEAVIDFYLFDTITVGDDQLVDPQFMLRGDTTLESITIPGKTGIGIALGIPDKLILTGDYYIQDWSGSMSGETYRTTRATSMHVGAEFIPDVEALRGFYNFISYRLGGYYSNSYLEVNGTQLKDYGITFGAGIPVRTLRSSINVAFTLGSRGTTENNLVKENYGIVTFNVTLHDVWFLKRRFD